MKNGVAAAEEDDAQEWVYRYRHHRDKHLYIGKTNDLEGRLISHQKSHYSPARLRWLTLFGQYEVLDPDTYLDAQPLWVPFCEMDAARRHRFKRPKQQVNEIETHLIERYSTDRGYWLCNKVHNTGWCGHSKTFPWSRMEGETGFRSVSERPRPDSRQKPWWQSHEGHRSAVEHAIPETPA